VIFLKRSEMKNFIQSLSADEASQVLRGLLHDHPDLTKKAYDIAMEIVGEVDADAIMSEVFNELDSLDIDDLNARSGRTRYGYVDPVDAAWELVEEALEPFINEMRINQQRGLPVAAKTYCIGIIKGLWKYEKESSSDLADWVPDARSEFIHTVVDEWKCGNPDDDDIAEVMSFADGD
jgi:tRNA isopentenyl-2-thiomethyl-A-37 hydroxylase MiaE